MDYNNKYLKYKYKYNLLKKIIGGFKLNDRDVEGSIYIKVENYYKKYETDFNLILKYINILELKKLFDFDFDELLQTTNIEDFNKLVKITNKLYILGDLEIEENMKNVTDGINRFIIILKSIIDIIELFNIKLYLIEIIKKLVKLLSEQTNTEELLSEQRNIEELLLKQENTKELLILIKELYLYIYNIISKYIEDILNKILNSEDRKKLLNELLKIYLNKEDKYINIQYAAFVFLSFIIEFELFMITYTKISYNYFKNTPFNYGYENLHNNIIFNNNYEVKWEGNIVTKIIYNHRFSNYITFILEEYIYYLEETYENFVNELNRFLKQYKGTQYLFNDQYGEQYDHLNHDWYDKIIENLALEKRNDFNQQLSFFIRNFISKYRYNTHQTGLFDFVFSLNHTCSCITKTTLKVYLTTRLHLQNYEVILQTAQPNYREEHKDITEILDCDLSHWECGDIKYFKSMPKMITTQKINIYNQKIQIFIALMFEIYIMYKKIFSTKYNSDINESKEQIIEKINNQQQLILDLIFDILSDEDKISFLLKYPNIINYFKNKYKIIIKELILYINNLIPNNDKEEELLSKIKSIYDKDFFDLIKLIENEYNKIDKFKDNIILNIFQNILKLNAQVTSPVDVVIDFHDEKLSAPVTSPVDVVIDFHDEKVIFNEKEFEETYLKEITILKEEITILEKIKENFKDISDLEKNIKILEENIEKLEKKNLKEDKILYYILVSMILNNNFENKKISLICNDFIFKFSEQLININMYSNSNNKIIWNKYDNIISIIIRSIKVVNNKCRVNMHLYFSDNSTYEIIHLITIENFTEEIINITTLFSNDYLRKELSKIIIS